MIEFGITNAGTICPPPFLLKSEEEEDNGIRFIVALTSKGKKGDGADEAMLPSLKPLLAKSNPLYPDDDNIFEIIFDSYIMYSVRNESFCSLDPYEKKQGDHFVIFEQSRLLDMLPHITDCQILSDGTPYPGKWTHYGIICQRHTIDVISCCKPIINQIDPI